MSIFAAFRAIPVSLSTALCAAGLLISSTPAAAQVGNWQVHSSGARHSFGTVVPNGDSAAYLSGAKTPAADDDGWVNATTDLNLRWTGPGGLTCRAQATYAYFQTFVQPTGNDGILLNFTNVDDAAVVAVFNDHNPNGVIVPDGLIGLRQNKSVDLTSSLVPGIANRIVIVLADVCGASTGLAAQFQLVPNGRAATGADNRDDAPPGTGRDAPEENADAAPAPAPVATPQPQAMAAPPPPFDSRPTRTDPAPAGTGAYVVFTSTDGSARIGSRSVFTLRNVATGDLITVPVVGRDAATKTVTSVVPGTYEVLPPPPSIGKLTSFVTRRISATQIIIPKSAVGRPQPAATIDFSLDVQVSPVKLTVDKITTDSVTLSWDSLQDVNVANYTLVRTDGTVAATSANGGTRIALAQPTATSATVQGLAPARDYSFALFATDSAGTKLPVRTFTVTTASPNPTDAAYAVAPNTIVPTNFASLNARRIADTRVMVTLVPAAIQRGSVSQIPGVDANATSNSGCVVGTPFLAKTSIAGNNAFYGVVDECGGQTQQGQMAVINTDVPLNAVFSYLATEGDTESPCFDAMTGADLPSGSTECQGRRNAENASADAPAGAAANAAAPASGARLTLPIKKGTDLVRGQRLWSQSGKHFLVLNPDGNLVVARADGGYVWGFNTQKDVDYRKVGRVTWQTDGNLAAYTADGKFVWSALHSNPDPNAELFLAPNGLLQIISGTKILWSAPPPHDLSLLDNKPTPPASSNLQLSGLASGNDFYRAIGAVSALPSLDLASSFAARRDARSAFMPETGMATAAWPAGNGAPSLAPLTLAAANASIGDFADKYCTSKGTISLTLNPYLDPYMKRKIELDGLGLTWDFQSSIVVRLTPIFEASAEFTCSADLPSKSIQITYTPIPINLEFQPDLSVTAKAAIKLEGPEMSVNIGVKSVGSASVDVEMCGVWKLKVPCGVGLNLNQNTTPIAEFSGYGVKANFEGTLTLRAGLEATLAFGYGNDLAKATAGFALNMSPLSLELKSVMGNKFCVQASVGYQIDAKLVAKAFLVGGLLEEKYEYPLYESGHKPYPGLAWGLGDCD